jgi:hypothetical protein
MISCFAFLWVCYPAISPNGETIAFTYKGDIYTVPANGGKATQLTTHPPYSLKSKSKILINSGVRGMIAASYEDCKDFGARLVNIGSR